MSYEWEKKIKTHVNDNEYADRVDLWHDRKSIHFIFVSLLDSHYYLGKKNKAHEISFALD